MAFGVGNFLRGLFKPGGSEAGAPNPAETVEYKGYSIQPTPRQQGSGWSTEGTITKSFPEGVKEARFIRADSSTAREDAVATSVMKAKRIIDEQGDKLFNQP